MKLNCPECHAEDVFEANYETLVGDAQRCPQCGAECEVEYEDCVSEDGEEYGEFWMELVP